MLIYNCFIYLVYYRYCQYRLSQYNDSCVVYDGFVDNEILLFSRIQFNLGCYYPWKYFISIEIIDLNKN